MSINLKIRPLPQQIRSFQLGYIPECLREQIKAGNVGSYIGVPLQPRERRALLRCSLLSLPQDVPDEIHCDLRVQQLFPAGGSSTQTGRTESLVEKGKELLSVSEPHELEMEDANKGTEENWKRKGEELLMVGRGRNDYSEIDLARHVAEMEAERTGGGVTTTRSGLAVAEKNFLFDELPSTVRFNDALVCTSKDIQILKSVVIIIRIKRLETFRGKIRNIFQTYDVHVGDSTIVDLNGCPLASFQAQFSPAIRFVFVEECEMSNLNTDVGKVSGKTEIIISNVHHISYYQRLLLKNSGQKLHLYGLESAAKMLHSLIEIQGRQLLAKQRDDSSVVGLTEFSHGFLISGPSGCGKVFVVRETAKKLGAHLLCFNPVGGSGTSSGFLEHVSHFCQQLSEIFMSALVTASRYPTVLLLPRIHLLFQSSSGNSPSSAKSFGFSSSKSGRERVLHHLCKLFDSIPKGLALSVVGTTDKAFLVPLQLRRAGRLEKEIIISPPKESERLQILQEMSKDLPQFKNVDLSMIASQTPGYVGQDLLKLLRLALFKCAVSSKF
ncbi:Spermatogenesis-associated protein 5-like protein 1, partial [Orchesella cincta]